MIRRYFFTGLALLLPAVVTILIVLFFINLLTKPFVNFTDTVLSHIGLLNKPFLFLSAEQVLHLVSKVLIVITLAIFTICAGLFAQIVAARYLIRLGDYIIHRIPIVNKIYKAAQDVVQTVFKEEKKTFTQVVLVPFPHEKSYSIGLVTNDCIPEGADSEHGGLVSVFLPATPNPTMGFMLMLRREQLIFLDMKVDDALKAIISCGVMISKISKADDK